MQYVMGPRGALTRRSSAGASTLFQRARVIFCLVEMTSVKKNLRVTQGMCATEGGAVIAATRQDGVFVVALQDPYPLAATGSLVERIGTLHLPWNPREPDQVSLG